MALRGMNLFDGSSNSSSYVVGSCVALPANKRIKVLASSSSSKVQIVIIDNVQGRLQNGRQSPRCSLRRQTGLGVWR